MFNVLVSSVELNEAFGAFIILWMEATHVPHTFVFDEEFSRTKLAFQRPAVRVVVNGVKLSVFC